MAGAPAHRLPYLHHGSSPHARGTLLGKNPQRAIERFIPACAGNAASALSPSWPASVHPRIRGERDTGTDRLGRVCGSSPHTRGTLPLAFEAGRMSRFIPAYAGNAATPVVSHRFRAVHPRIRGEHPQLMTQ